MSANKSHTAKRKTTTKTSNEGKKELNKTSKKIIRNPIKKDNRKKGGKEENFSLLSKKFKRNNSNYFKKESTAFNNLLSALIKENDMESENDENLINIKPISQYIDEKKKLWENNKNSDTFNFEEFSKSTGILEDFNYQYLKKLLMKDINLFIENYKFSQYTLSVWQRKEFQNKIKDKCTWPIIINNFVSESTKTTKEIFINLCRSIIDIEDCCDSNIHNNLKEIFLKNGVYSEDLFKPFIPVAFGNNDLKMNRLIFEIVQIFYKSQMNIENLHSEEISLISEKLIKFQEFKPVFDKFELFIDDNELFQVCNYLFNCFFAFFDVARKKRNEELFEKIISCCIPFELEMAKKFLTELKLKTKKNKIYIDKKDLRDYDISIIQEKSEIFFEEKKITILFKDLNYNLKPSIFNSIFQSDKFMLCFRFPKLCEINYLYINEEIRQNYRNLFKIIINSPIMKEAMNIDNDAKLIEYPFSNNSIFDEIENNCFLSPLPANNYFGISDRTTFAIYLNSIINSSSKKTLFIDIDNITKSKCHEIKNMYRVYLHLYRPDISLKIPLINYKTLNENQLVKDKYDIIQKKREIMENIYKSKSVPSIELDKFDYGDILEFAFNGVKQNVFFFEKFFVLPE